MTENLGNVFLGLFTLLIVELLIRFRVEREVESKLGSVKVALEGFSGKIEGLGKKIEQYEGQSVERYVIWKEDLKRELKQEIKAELESERRSISEG